jgi:hypothetical protein
VTAWIAEWGAVAVAVGAAALASIQTGCGECTGTYSCAPALYGEVNVPADLPAPITKVTANEPCTAVRLDSSPTAPVLVSVKGSIDANRTVTCHVRAQLSDGTQRTASVSFQPLVGCCSHLSRAIDGPATFSLVAD